MIIRKYVANDVDSMMDVWKKSSKIAHSFLPEEHFINEESEIRNVFLPVSDTWVAEINGKIVGFISMVDNSIGGLFIDPAHQRKGIGTALVNIFRDKFDTLEVEVFEKNMQGRKFYKKTGFVIKDTSIEESTKEVSLNLFLKTRL